MLPALLLILLFAVPAAVPARDLSGCNFGAPLTEQVVLRPRTGTFYSVDVLNPDVVRFRGEYLLFFSGNSARIDAGEWRTGLAASPSPKGPFLVDRRVRKSFFNGGTVVKRGSLLHAANVPGRREAILFKSASGRAWREAGAMPAPQEPSWRFWPSDLYLRSRGLGLDAWFAGRPAPEGADIGFARYESGRWSGFARVLRRDPANWDGADLGEPAVFRVGGRAYMLYVGQGGAGRSRQIGLARREPGGWRRCSDRPFIPIGGRARLNAIDPEPLVLGKRLYVYYGAGQTASQGGNMSGVILLRTYRLP